MAIIVKLIEPYYREFHKRKDVFFDDQDAVEIYKSTQDLQLNWPKCLRYSMVPPEVVKHDGDLYYLRFNFAPPQQIKFRICFGVRTIETGDIEIVALTCRTKQELSGRSKTDEYRRNRLVSWRIY